MISYFPAPYNGELFWSVIARYHKRSLEVNPTETIQMLCSDNNMDVRINFENILNKLIFLEYSTLDEIIKNNTAYNYYVFFRNDFERGELLRKTINGDIYYDTVKTKLRFCPQCQTEDIENIGETYWRYFHQIPSVFICLKHSILLQESTVDYNKYAPYAANERNCLPLPHKKIYRNVFLLLQRITVESEYILKNDIHFDHSKVQLFVAHCLKSKGLIDHLGMVKKSSLLYQLNNTFGHGFFQAIDLSVEDFVENIFVVLEQNGFKSYISSIELLILIIFLSGSVKMFVNRINNFSPRVWKCLVCGNNSLMIRLLPDLETNKCLMKTTCTCGIIQDSTTGDRYLTNNTLRVIFTTKEQKLDYIYNKIFIKGFNVDRLSWKMNLNVIQIEHLLAQCLDTKHEDRFITKKYKDDWKALATSSAPIEELKILNYPAYIWLRTYAPEFLNTFYYPQLNNSLINNDIWNKRDKQVKEILRTSLLTSKLSGKGARTIIKMNYRYSQEICLDKSLEIAYLPETKKFIDKLTNLYERLFDYRY